MNRFMGLLLGLMAFFAAQAQTAAPAAPALTAKEAVHQFGQIPQGKPVYHTFTVVNKSNQPVKLENVSATCGCTTPEWSKIPIAPGGSSQIRVGFNAAAEGPFEKYVNVLYNNGQALQMTIKGNVWAAPAGAAPANAAVQFLKQQTQ